jgi:lipoprotein-anchoring transpeptidase ErfK/SrfK
MMNRRLFAGGLGLMALGACAPRPPIAPPLAFAPAVAAPIPPLPAFYGAVLGEPFPVPPVPEGVVHPRLWRQEVDNPWPDETPGTIIVDPSAGYLHLVQEGGARALRYGAGTGAAAFAWSGVARNQFGREWPRWNVPEEMAERRPELRPYTVANGGMDPGPGNPLGARALYLFQDGVDTLYRIHGGCEPHYLGRAVSSGCVRLLDQDAIDLYDRVPHGARVVVLPAAPPDFLSEAY